MLAVLFAAGFGAGFSEGASVVAAGFSGVEARSAEAVDFLVVPEGREVVRVDGFALVVVRAVRDVGFGVGVGVVGAGVGLLRRPKSRSKKDGFLGTGVATGTGVALAVARRDELCCAKESGVSRPKITRRMGTILSIGVEK